MRRSELIAGRLLDPRGSAEAAERPIAGAANIPWHELPVRTHELPPRDCTTMIADVPPASGRALAWFANSGRAAELCEGLPLRPVDGPQPVIRLWRPAPFLVDILPSVIANANEHADGKWSPGDALDLACGTGRDAVYLAAEGWQLTGVDVLPDALQRGADLARRYANDAHPIRWIKYDLESNISDAPAAAPLDEAAPHGRGHGRGTRADASSGPAASFLDRRYDLITVFRFLHRPLFRRLRDWLVPGGSVVCETFTTVHGQRYGKPSRAAHLLQPGELPGLLAGLEIRHFDEAFRGDCHTARAWATKPAARA